MQQYHFRNFLGTPVPNEKDGHPLKIYELPNALHMAYTLSAERNESIIVCKDSDTNGNTGFVEIAQVRCRP